MNAITNILVGLPHFNSLSDNFRRQNTDYKCNMTSRDTQLRFFINLSLEKQRLEMNIF